MTTDTQITFDHPISLTEAANVIAHCGDKNSILLQGEPGVGKSSILKMLTQKFGAKYIPIYFDCALKEPGDVSMNIPVHTQKRLEQYISDQFDFTQGKPFMVMLDEYMKAPKLMQVMFTRLVLERCVGDRPLPEGSIVFGTSNNQSDGVGDAMLAHSANRLSVVKVRKPTAAEWCIWANENGISATMRAWVSMTKKLFDSYTTLEAKDLENNPFIFNPKKPQISFVSPRSLEKGDNFVQHYNKIGPDVANAMLGGTIGKAAADSLYAFILLERELLRTEDVVKDPLGVPVPTKMSANFMMMFNAIDDLLTQDDLTAFLKFVDRIGHREVYAIFFTMLLQTKRTVKLAKNNRTVMDWAANNLELFV